MKKLFFTFLFILVSIFVFTDEPTFSIPNNFVYINGGTFLMGSPVNEPNRGSNEVQHQVTVSSFIMGIYTVTQKEYEDIMGINPSHFRGQSLPVEMVTWYDAVEYCNKRSQKERLTPAYAISNRIPTRGYPITSATVTWNRNANGYRLPTEAEWEYACRAGTTTAFNTGDTITASQANFGGYQFADVGTKDVGTFQPNAWGLYDMHGNLREWCWDISGDYPSSPQIDPIEPASVGWSTSFRVIRGGAWTESSSSLRSAYRIGTSQSNRNNIMGFRIVLPANGNIINRDHDSDIGTRESSFSGRFYGQRTSYEFIGNNFSGYFNTTRILWGTYTVSDNKLNLHVTGGIDGETSQFVTLTIIDPNTIADNDGTLYRRR